MNLDNSHYELPNNISVHQIRNHYKGSGVSGNIHKNFEFKIRNDLSINCKDIESIGVGLLHEKRRKTLFNVVYKPPNGKMVPFEKFSKNLFNKSKNFNKYNQVGCFRSFSSFHFYSFNKLIYKKRCYLTI